MVRKVKKKVPLQLGVNKKNNKTSKRKSTINKKYTLKHLKQHAKDQRGGSGVMAQFSYLNKKGELDRIKCGLLIATKTESWTRT
jgi:hypothetical protein